MAFQTPITVREAVENVHAKKYLLPAIQREVVWEVDQITRLFDSLMRDYPIGSFLFWHVDKKNTGSYQFYEFVRDYHEKTNKHNQKANVSGEDEITGVLDGQQRLTSLYIGLRGSYAYKEPWKKWNNPLAFPIRRLYLNLLAPKKDGDETDMIYDFAFRTDADAETGGDDVFWFKVGDILDLKDPAAVNAYLIEHGLMSGSKEQAAFANSALFKLWEVVHKTGVINYFLEEDQSLDKVLNIFIRVNSGGTVLSYSDLLLSIAAAQWRDRDAREEITSFVDELNNMGDGFAFNKDLVLKSSLVLANVTNIAFKVDNFNRINMLQIEREWDDITSALRGATTLVSAFGYNRDTLTANNAIIPIAYYLRQRGLPGNFAIASQYLEDRRAIRNWLVLCLVKRVFGGSSDSVLRQVREVLRESGNHFPYGELVEQSKGTNKSLVVTADDIENMVSSRYGQGYTFSTLSLLYPSFDFRNKFHLDHIHPRSHFTRARLRSRQVPEPDLDFYMDSFDGLPNLQLLEGIPNQEKSDKDFAAWLSSSLQPDAEADFRRKHFIPDTDLSLTNFREFYKQRKDEISRELSRILGVT